MIITHCCVEDKNNNIFNADLDDDTDDTDDDDDDEKDKLIVERLKSFDTIIE